MCFSSIISFTVHPFDGDVQLPIRRLLRLLDEGVQQDHPPSGQAEQDTGDPSRGQVAADLPQAFVRADRPARRHPHRTYSRVWRSLPTVVRHKTYLTRCDAPCKAHQPTFSPHFCTAWVQGMLTLTPGKRCSKASRKAVLASCSPWTRMTSRGGVDMAPIKSSRSCWSAWAE